VSRIKEVFEAFFLGKKTCFHIALALSLFFLARLKIASLSILYAYFRQ
jgi:hypothetical protein